MTRVGQTTFWVVTALAGALVIVVLLVVADLDGIGKGTIEAYGSAATGATVTVEDVDISLRNHEAKVHGLWIGNPEGFATDYALRFGAIELAVNAAASTDDVVFIDRLFVDGASVVAECREELESNLGVMFANVLHYAGLPSSTQAGNLPFRLVIEEFVLSGGELRLVDGESGLDETVLLPGFALAGIGSRNGGATFAEVKSQLFQPIIQKTLEASLCLDCCLSRG